MADDVFRAIPLRVFSTARVFIFVLLYCFFPLFVSAQIITTFSNPNPITIIDDSPGSPYPSTISVSNVASNASKVTVTLKGLTHTFPGDVDVMLVGPGGQRAMLMSDVGSANSVSGINLTVDDAAATTMPQMLFTGTFRPTNNDTTTDVFPPPAPSSNGAGALSVFNGTDPNGTWSLYVRDDTGADMGSFGGGWTLTIVNAISGQNTGFISIPNNGIASPYPSAINLANLTGLVSSLQVNLINFSHSSPDDVDLVLVAPNGRKVVLMSDVGGANPVANLNLTFDDAAANSLPDDTALTSGTYRPTDFQPGDAYPAPAPAGAPTGRTLSALNGSGPNGLWRLFLVDDSGGNAGSISGGWSIVVRSSLDVIDIPDTGLADPYPSSLAISALPGNVTKATVTLTGFSHTSPDDVDILLVAPNGRRVVLMSDAGGTAEVSSATLVFDDLAATAVPDNSQIVSGSYKPADYEPGDAYPAPAPSGPMTGNTLGAFYGSAPNGLWRLFVVDDNGNSPGSITGGWSLNLETSQGACQFEISPQIQSFPISGGNGLINITMPAGCSWTASASTSFITLTSAPSGDASGTLTFSVAPNSGLARTGTIDISNGVTVRTFQVQQASGCPSSASQTSFQFGPMGGGGNVAVTAGGGCSWQASASAGWLHVTTPPHTGSGNLTFTVDPNTSINARLGTITSGPVTISITQEPARAARFDFDGDLRADLSIFRPSDGTWWLERSSTPGSYNVTPFGISTDRLTPADYDGDRKADISVYRNGTWYIYQSQSNTVRYDLWGLGTDIPVPGDFDGDQKADTAIYRPSAGQWWVRRSTGGEYAVTFGGASDKPLVGDYDGDGRSDLVLYAPGGTPSAPSSWTILQSSNGTAIIHTYGLGEDIPVVGDFDRDGRDNVAVFRPSTGSWYTSFDPGANWGLVQWGMAGDVPVAADYNGDGRADYAVFRNGTWYIRHAGSGTTRTDQWGTAGDKPAAAAFNP